MSIRATDKVTGNPSDYIVNRSSKMRVTLVRCWDEGDDEDTEQVTEFRVKPAERGSAVRVVSFHRQGVDVRIVCFDEKTLVACPRNRYGKLCSHVNAAITGLLKITKGT